ncbi:hypothetical protein VDGD_20502 [Verticillium dahliae]|nr:hypothetical protein VDGD_20502 [Verticillium dahliae]
MANGSDGKGGHSILPITHVDSRSIGGAPFRKLLNKRFDEE